MSNELDRLLEPFKTFSEHSIADLDTWRSQGGKTAGVYCIYAPNELIRAAGIVPISLCGKKQNPIRHAEQHLPASFCPLIKSSYGYGITDTCPFFSFSDFLVAETTCDGKKKMYELLQKVKPIHLMQLPHTQTGQAAFDYWLSAFKKLETFLVSQSGRVVSTERLRQEIRQQNSIRKLLSEVALLAADRRSPVKATDMLAVQESKSFSVFPEKYHNNLIYLKSGLDNFLSRPDLPQDNSARILLTGCPVGKGSDKIIHIAQNLGARIVAMENCSGIKGMTLAVEESGDPVTALVHRYLQIPCSCMSPNPGRIADIREMVELFDVDAVLDLTWLGCHTYNGESYSIRQFVEHELQKPFLHIETDYSESDTEQLKTRIEALMELI